MTYRPLSCFQQAMPLLPRTPVFPEIHLSSARLEQANTSYARSFIDETQAAPANPTCHHQVLPRFQLAAHICIHSWLSPTMVGLNPTRTSRLFFLTSHPVCLSFFLPSFLANCQQFTEILIVNFSNLRRNRLLTSVIYREIVNFSNLRRN